MSQENVDTARRAVDAVNRRDVATLDSLWTDEGEFNSRLAASEGHVFRGRQGIRDYFAWLDEAFEQFRTEVEEIIDAGEDRVVALLRASVRGRASGVPLDDQRFAIVITFQGERIARADSYLSPAEALEAAGLSEQAMSQEKGELSYQAVNAMNRRDLDGLLALMDDEVEAVSFLAAMEGGYHGHAGIRRWWQNLLDVFPDFNVEVVEVRDLGGDSTLATLRTGGHGSGSGTPIDMLVWMAVRIRDGKCVWWQVFGNKDEALEAVGLSE